MAEATRRPRPTYGQLARSAVRLTDLHRALEVLYPKADIEYPMEQTEAAHRIVRMHQRIGLTDAIKHIEGLLDDTVK